MSTSFNCEYLFQPYIPIAQRELFETIRFLIWDFRNFYGDIEFVVEWMQAPESFDYKYRVRPA